MDTNELLLKIAAIFVLILANGFFAASELSLIAARKSRIKHLAEKGNRRAERTAKLLKVPDRFLAAVQVGITIIATLAGVFGGATLVEGLSKLIATSQFVFISSASRPISIVVIVVGISYFSIVLGELIPKYIALANPEKLAIRVSGPISLFSRMAFIPVSFLSFSARLVLRLFGFSHLAEKSRITEEDINLLVSEGTEEGVFDQTEKRMIKSVFDFGDISVRQAMTPRVDITGIQQQWSKENVLKVITSTGFSRYPVYEESIDQVVGVVYAKDLIAIMAHGESIILRDIVRKPLFVPDSMLLSTLLNKFQGEKIHIAIVLDEFGGTAGLITLEDILEEIVGEIQDEHDYTDPEFVLHSPQVAFAAGSLRPDELNELFGVDLPEEESDTLAGLIIDRLGRMPEIAESITIADTRFEVLEMEGNRIKRIKVEKKKNESA